MIHSRIIGLSFFLMVMMNFHLVVSAQTGYSPIDENLLIESKWLYTYTSHAPTNSVIHKADESYEYYLYLKFDNTYEHYLNGNTSDGDWLLNEDKNELFYNFRQIRWWKIAELSKTTLMLEFVVDKVPYRYHFVRIGNQSSPFKKKNNELPDVEVEADITTEELVQDAREEMTRKEKRQEKRKNKKQSREDRKDRRIKELENNETTIEIALTGGGFYGGLDPVIKDFTVIKSDGRLVKEFETVNQGLRKVRLDIGREQVEQLAEFMTNKGFFEFSNLYDCQTGDCNKRKTKKPTPIPLRISFTYGNRRKVVTVVIWGLDDQKIQYVNYPRDLDYIIESIQKLSMGN